MGGHPLKSSQACPAQLGHGAGEVAGEVGDRGADCTVSQQAGLGSASSREIKGD